MPVNADFAGRTYPPSPPYTVSRAKIAEFAESVRATDPVHVDVEVARSRGYADVIAPPTFAILVSMQADQQVMQDPEAGIDYSRVVHGEQTFEQHHPLVAGDEIVTTMTVASVKEIAGNAMITTRSELRTVEGDLRCTSITMLVVRGEN